MVAVSTPYVAGFLAFREVPVLVEAVQRLQQEEPALQPQVPVVVSDLGCAAEGRSGLAPQQGGRGSTGVALEHLCLSPGTGALRQDGQACPGSGSPVVQRGSERCQPSSCCGTLLCTAVRTQRCRKIPVDRRKRAEADFSPLTWPASLFPYWSGSQCIGNNISCLAFSGTSCRWEWPPPSQR